ncbi:hypothetical protein ACIQ57_01015 [Lysinibacillus xylanilyticus]|uniref:hypothetical protein n=1 Tax=Lysinibacillus xylanilyticus TaxID=582475 RepID=UPI00380B9395
MKKLYITIAVFFSLYMVYINSTAENVIYMDQIRMTSLIEKYFNGSLTFLDLWSSYLGHRSLGYHLIFVMNAALFNLNSLIEINISAICLLVVAIILLRSYYLEFNDASILKEKNNKNVIKVNLITIIIVLFSLNKWETALLGLGLNEYLVNVLFIVMFYLFNQFLIHKTMTTKMKIVLFLSLNFSIIFFSLAYVAPFFFALYLIFIIDFLIKKQEIKSKLPVITIYTINAFLLCLIYLFNINSQSANAKSLSIFEKIFTLIAQPVSVVKFYFYGLSGSVFGVETAQKIIGNNILLMLGVFVFLFYIISIYLFFRNKLYNINYFPLLLIMYSLTYMGLVLVGRLEYGELYGLQSRYSLAMMYGLIGIVWIFSLVLKQTTYNFKIKIFNFSFITVLILCIMLTNLDEIRKSPYREQAYQNMRTYAFYGEWENWEVFQYDEDSTKKAFETLKKYNLNVYYDYPKIELKELGTNIKQFKIEQGIYQDGENSYWVSKSGSIKVKSGQTGHVAIEGFMNDVYDTNNISVYVDETQVVDEIIKPGNVKLSFFIEPNKVHTIKIEIEKTFIPYEMGINNDKRELGIIINKLNIE